MLGQPTASSWSLATCLLGQPRISACCRWKVTEPAIRLAGAAGDITGTDQIIWTRKRGTPYVPSLLLVEDSLYYLRHYQGPLSRVNVRTGEDQGGPFRLAGIYNVYASIISA